MKKKLAIIGSGIAGLTFANLIKKYTEHEFMLYEKDDSASIDEGYGIQLSVNAINILNKIDFKKINREKIYQPSGIDFYNIQNKKICDLDLTKFNTDKCKYTTLNRSTLIEFLKDNIYTQHLRFGKKLKEVSEIKDKVLLKFEDNTNDLVDFVIGADGIFSNTRNFFEKKKNEPKFRNAVAIRSLLKSKFELAINEKRINLMLGKECHLAIYPVNKHGELNLVCIVRTKKYDPDKIKQLIDKATNQNLNLIKAFSGNIKSWPLYSTPRILPSTNSKVFYIGDAFNGFLPTLAQGAGQSIESAYELSNLLKENKTDIQTVYFQGRFKRAKIVRSRSNLNFFVFHFSSNILQKIRNFIMKFLIRRKGFVNSYLGKVYKS